MLRLLAPFLVILGAVVVAMSLEERLPRADVVVSQTRDCFTLDPQRMSYMHDLRMARSLYEGLLRRDNLTSEFMPGVAESWNCSEDGLVWTFKLRSDARWSNGDPVTTGDFVYSWRRAMMPDSAADYSDLFFAIRGGREFFRRRLEGTSAHARMEFDDPTSRERAARELLEETFRDFNENVGIEAVDDHTLRVELERPLAYFLDLCAFSVFAPVHPPSVEAYVGLDPASGMLTQKHGWTRAGELVSNGPYLLARRRIKHDIRLVRNPYYWNPGAVKPDSVEVLCIEDPNTSVLAYEVGTVDWVSDVSVEYLADMMDQYADYVTTHSERYEERLGEGLGIDEILAGLPAPEAGERRDLHTSKAFGTFFFSFNCRPLLASGEPNPLVDPRVRRALSMAVDKKTIVDRVLRTGEPVAGSLVPPGSIPGYQPPSGLDYDPERARTLLEEAGWVDRDGDSIPENEAGEEFPPVDFLYTTGVPRYRDMGLAMSDMWKNHLGIETNLRSKDTKAYRADLRNGTFMIARGGWYGDYGDPMTFLELSETGNGNNDRGYSDAGYDGLLERARDMTDAVGRMELLHEAEHKVVVQDLPIMPVYHFTTSYLYDPTRLRGLTRHPRLQQEYWRLERLSGE